MIANEMVQKSIRKVNEGLFELRDLGFRTLNPDCSKREDGLKFLDFITAITSDEDESLILGIAALECEEEE